MLNYNLPTIILLLLFTASLQLKVDAAGEEEKDQFYAYNREDYSDVVNWLKRYGKEIANPAQKICQNQLKKPTQPELAQKLCATVSKLDTLIHDIMDPMFFAKYFYLRFLRNEQGIKTTSRAMVEPFSRQVYGSINGNAFDLALKNSGKLTHDEAKEAQEGIDALFEHKSKLRGGEKENKIRMNLKEFYKKSIKALENSVLEKGEDDKLKLRAEVYTDAGKQNLRTNAYTLMATAEWLHRYFNFTDRESLQVAMLEFAANLLVYGFELEQPKLAELTAQWVDIQMIPTIWP